ncbi:MAG: caspase family protein, partial [Pseudomonadota bacterium]
VVRNRGAGGIATARKVVVSMFRNALVIGIDTYTNGWPRLSNAIKDAELVGDALEAQGFEVERLIDPTGAELRAALRHFYAIRGADPEARLFLWFAGHGYTTLGEGYLVGADAPVPSEPDFLIEAIHMRELGSMARLARAKHALAVFDSCFSGTIFTAQRALPPPAITRAVIQPVRQFLTSGDADQVVSDDGTFRKLFVDALAGDDRADLNSDGYLTGSELGMYLEDRMTNLSAALQTPRWGKLRDLRFDRGDFVFVLPDRRARTAEGPKPSASMRRAQNAELIFWDTVKDSGRAVEFRAYLETFPEGMFSEVARARLTILEQAERQAAALQANETEPADASAAPVEAPAATVSAPEEMAPSQTAGSSGEAVLAMEQPTVIVPAPRPQQTGNNTDDTVIAALPPATAPAEQGQATELLGQGPREIAEALLAYEDMDRLILLPPDGRDPSRVTIEQMQVLASSADGAVAMMSLSIRTGWVRTVINDVFAFSLSPSGELRVLKHGNAARALIRSRG